MIGMGVMIKELGGNADSVAAFTGAVGKTISSLDADGDRLRIAFDDGTAIAFSDEGQSCCENRFMVCDDDLTPYIGSKLLGAEVSAGPDEPDEYGTHEVEFLRVETSAGIFTVANHNEHNGYYGGFSVRVRND